MNSQGWECPKCGRVYSPNTLMCMYCSKQSVTRGSIKDTGLTVEWTNKDILSKEE